MYTLNIPQPIIDCGLDIFVLNAEFLRAQSGAYLSGSIAPESFAHWCILTGYLEGRVSVFRPELVIGVDGHEIGRDPQYHIPMLQEAFRNRFADENLPSLMGDIPIIDPFDQHASVSIESPAARALTRPVQSLLELVNLAVQPIATPISLSVITRTRFARSHLLRRMLSSLTRARQQLDMALEIILTTDIDETDARSAHQLLQADFPELNLALQCNKGRYPHSRVDNLMGGIMAATKDYIAIIDDDDFVDLDALKVLSTARFLDSKPLLLMSSQVRRESWRKSAGERWILESSKLERTYFADNYRHMFSGVNHLPICAMIAPRIWIQQRLENIALRHDLSEDYAIYLSLLCAPDRPPLLTFSDTFCIISSRDDDSNTITMSDRRPWVRDITLFLHDLFVSDPISGSGIAQMLGQAIQPPHPTNTPCAGSAANSLAARQGREIALLRTEISHLRGLMADAKTVQ